MKNIEMASFGNVSIKPSEKFENDHPYAATLLYLAPFALPYLGKGAKYIVDKAAECYKVKVMSGKALPITTLSDDLEIISVDDSIVE